MEAWLAEKDVEALRFQKMLMEEEEAAQKRFLRRWKNHIQLIFINVQLMGEN